MDHTKDSTTVLLLVRHTDVHNPADVLYGRLPRYRLSDLGRQQAEVTASVLAEMPVNAIYSSPQMRARQTARILAAAHSGLKVHISKLLDEVRTSWQGTPASELEKIGFNFYGNPLHETDERLDELWARMQKFVRRTRARHKGETVVAVSHGDPVILARAGYLGLPLTIESIRLPFVYPGKGSLTRLTFASDEDTYPVSVEYYDPNSDDPTWSQGWVKLGPSGHAT